jgi:hypothetical protein
MKKMMAEVVTIQGSVCVEVPTDNSAPLLSPEDMTTSTRSDITPHTVVIQIGLHLFFIRNVISVRFFHP